MGAFFAIAGLFLVANPLAAREGSTKPHAFTQARTFDSVEDLTGALTPTDLAQLLAGPGVTVSNVRYSGGNLAAGTFSGGNDIIGITEGVILSSGDVNDVVGPNELDDTTTDNGQPGDADLEALSGFDTFDATVLEFDIVPTASTLFINYVFASEEYNEFVGSEFNDVFAFFVNGVNCALVGSDPVSVNTINNGNPFGGPPNSNPGLYRNNDLDDGGGGIDTEMDGLTVVLTCEAPVTPNVINTIKLAIADASDEIYDSAVFLSASGITIDDGNDSPDGPGVISLNPGDVIKGTVGGGDPTDFFKLDLSGAARAGLSNVNISLRDLTENLDLFLFAEGSAQPLASSEAPGANSEFISRSLDPGVYNIEIRPFLNAQSGYTLEFQAAAGAAAFSNISFNGLVNEVIRPAFIQLDSAEVVITAESLGLPDPRVSLKRISDSSTVAFNDNCDAPNIADLIGRPLAGPFDACIVQTLAPGLYFFEVTGSDVKASGDALAGVTQPLGSNPALLNISYNGFVPAAGIKPAFNVAGGARIVITAESFGLPNPQVALKRLFDQSTVAFNDDCDDPDIADLVGRPLNTAQDACIVIDQTEAGAFFVEVSDVGGGSGNALVGATQIAPK